MANQAPFSIDQNGDRKKRLADHVALVAGTDANGNAKYLSVSPEGGLPTTANTSTTAATLTQAVKNVAAAGTPERMAAVSTLVESVEILARKSLASANTGNVLLGFTAGVGTQLRILAAGDTFPMSAPAGKKIDLHDIWLDVGTSGDGVIYSALN